MVVTRSALMITTHFRIGDGKPLLTRLKLKRFWREVGDQSCHFRGVECMWLSSTIALVPKEIILPTKIYRQTVKPESVHSTKQTQHTAFNPQTSTQKFSRIHVTGLHTWFHTRQFVSIWRNSGFFSKIPHKSNGSPMNFEMWQSQIILCSSSQL